MTRGKTAVDDSSIGPARTIAAPKAGDEDHRDRYFAQCAAPESYEVIAQSGERRHFGSGPAAFIVRVADLPSVGMYEHVGRHRLEEYFRALAHLLEPDGLLLNHGIARPQDTRDDSSTVFLHRHVFPGGELPQLADIVRSAERAGVEVLDVENLRPHYAMMCAAWVANLMRHRSTCLTLVDGVTYRTWLLYLAASAVSLERGETELYQTLLAKRGTARRRLTRTHMYVPPDLLSSLGSQ